MRPIRQIFGGLGNNMFQGAYILGQALDGKIPDLYIQHSKWWKKHEERIKKLYREGIVESDFVSLHIRRGDYVNNPFYVDLTQTEYYDKAIALFPNEKFLVFCADRQDGSDDILDQEWVMNWLIAKYGDRFTLFEGFNEIQDFNRMAGCKAHIMANSSFSWWASFVGGGKVVAPLQWYTDGIERTELLDEWIKL